VVLRALAKEPRQRFPSVKAFAAAFQKAVEGTLILADTLLPSLAPKAEPPKTFMTLSPPFMGSDSLTDLIHPPAALSSFGDHEAQMLPQPAQLVGRKAEWTQLTSAWKSAIAGHPHLLLLTGDAGIGKTRLAETLLAE